MTSLFSLLRHICGLSQKEAAAFLDTRLDTIRSWDIARRNPASAVISDLADLAARIDAAADEAVEQIADIAADLGPGGTVELGLAADDYEAQSLGWPSLGAHKAVIGLTAVRALAEGHAIEIVPRGSTTATAAAIEIHDH